MKFFIILIGVLLERWMNVGKYLNRFSWFERYTEVLRSSLAKTGLWVGFAGVACAVLPLLVVVAVVYFALHNILHDVIGYILAIAVLVYCFGPSDIYGVIQRYTTLNDSQNPEAAKQQIDKFLAESAASTDLDAADSSNYHRAITKAIFIKFNENIFAVVFWFAVLGPLGPLGAVLYRAVDLINASAHKDGSPNAPLASAAKCCHELLDWLPVRLLGLWYGLIGNFGPTFSYWLSNAGSGVDKNRDLALHCGLLSIDADDIPADHADLSENNAALQLTDRALILTLVVVGLIALGMLL
jgi:AmpE protein